MYLCTAVVSGRAQVLLKPPIEENRADLAALSEEESRTDLRCEVAQVKPYIGFDLRYHSGYTVSIPMEELVGHGDRLRVLMKITSESKPEEPVYLADSFDVPPLSTELRGEAGFPGEFILGPGRYHVKWIVRGQEGRGCSSSWDLEAKPTDWLDEVWVGAEPNTVSAYVRDPFRSAAPVEHDAGSRRLHVKLLVNFSPDDPDQVTLLPTDLRAIMSMVRAVVREPGFSSFSLVAFSTRDEKILFRQDDAPGIDFTGLGKSVGDLTFGTVEYERLIDTDSEARFLTGLLTEDIAGQHQPVDAVVIIGPKVFLEKGIPKEKLRHAGLPNYPIFYLNYRSDPTKNPWRDAIGRALRVLRGFEYAISRPRDLASALLDMRSRLSDLRQSLLSTGQPIRERR